MLVWYATYFPLTTYTCPLIQVNSVVSAFMVCNIKGHVSIRNYITLPSLPGYPLDLIFHKGDNIFLPSLRLFLFLCTIQPTTCFLICSYRAIIGFSLNFLITMLNVSTKFVVLFGDLCSGSNKYLHQCCFGSLSNQA